MEPGSPSLLHANQRYFQSPVGLGRRRSRWLEGAPPSFSGVGGGRRRLRPEVSARHPDLFEPCGLCKDMRRRFWGQIQME